MIFQFKREAIVNECSDRMNRRHLDRGIDNMDMKEMNKSCPEYCVQNFFWVLIKGLCDSLGTKLTPQCGST